ncbi:7-carboxy-7-deazaguanine synthase QueE [Sporomusa acidovorans]|uniref:7-carboxy-7-deazaguanine synthase n=1 Tax=Sporomusa acidovorans (strain ATCC 49682 / DSM 3132 / Mol) TaxID=1123286 RepID=A0ABZ3J3K6_SPOA4|nr:7-carboxy-7-deazaguanine synthase QueE [Sporomusa acidovorans]OZC20190.1 7-carboxy-7-deazaguanine synthase [Sporomusa acidovorans DSM 3132]SDD42502.1 Organic radical activating enzyme [Sporomusa acidovorans]
MINIVEVFSSIQGEGLYVGTRQVFVRLAGCNLACTYCDTPNSHHTVKNALVERTPGKRDFAQLPMQFSIDNLARHINSLLAVPHHSISLTGGEPLCQAKMIAELLPQLKAPLYLETNGTLFQQLALVLPYIDIISMDIKLPTVTDKPYWQEHKEFLLLAARKNVFVKIVVTGKSQQTELQQAFELVASVDHHIPVILQPVTPVNGCEAVLPDVLLFYQEKALTLLNDVRVIPQTHKFMGYL